MKRIYVLNILIFLNLISCQPSKESKATNEIATIDRSKFPKGKKCIKNGDGIRYTIKMNTSKEVVLDDLLDKSKDISVISLSVPDDDFLLGDVSKLWIRGDNQIVIADMEITHKIYSFDANGEMQFAIDNKGKGPGQYNTLWDVQLNKSRKTIDIWDLSMHRLISYNYDGSFLTETIVNREIINFYPVTKDWYIYHIDGRDAMGKKSPLLLYSDIRGDQVMNTGATEYGIVDAWRDQLEFSEYNGSVYYLRPGMDTIYWIGPVNGQICADYIIDFGKDRLTQEAKKQTDLMQSFKLIEQAKSSYTLGNLVVGTTYLHFKWFSEKDLLEYHHFVDRFDYKSYKIPSKSLDFFGIPITKIVHVDGLRFTASSYPYKVNKNKLKEAIDNKSLAKGTRKNLSKILNMKDQEMPFLIQFTLDHALNSKYE